MLYMFTGPLDSWKYVGFLPPSIFVNMLIQNLLIQGQQFTNEIYHRLKIRSCKCVSTLLCCRLAERILEHPCVLSLTCIALGIAYLGLALYVSFVSKIEDHTEVGMLCVVFALLSFTAMFAHVIAMLMILVVLILPVTAILALKLIFYMLSKCNLCVEFADDRRDDTANGAEVYTGQPVNNSVDMSGYIKQVMSVFKTPFRKAEHHEEVVCSICLDALAEGEAAVQLSCGENHVFHEACLSGWAVKKSTCPNCRANFIDNMTVLVNFV